MIHPNIIANFFVHKALTTGVPVTPMKLVKLVYVAHGWYLALTDKPLISEPVQAWKFGPVIPAVYHAFKSFGGDNISSYTHNIIGDASITSELEIFLNKIWNVYLNFNGVQMSSITHEQGTPWSIAWSENRGRREIIIPNDLIKQHYKQKASAGTR